LTARETLLATVLENPDDDTARLVLADLLRESDNAEERARGRFVWAGITAASYRDADLIEDKLFYIAQAEIAAVAADGFPAQWLAAIGVGPSPLTTRDWVWDTTVIASHSESVMSAASSHGGCSANSPSPWVSGMQWRDRRLRRGHWSGCRSLTRPV